MKLQKIPLSNEIIEVIESYFVNFQYETAGDGSHYVFLRPHRISQLESEMFFLSTILDESKRRMLLEFCVFLVDMHRKATSEPNMESKSDDETQVGASI